MGDIGTERRLEYAVNTARRLEALTRSLGTPLVTSHALITRVREEVGERAIGDLRRHVPMVDRGRAKVANVWT